MAATVMLVEDERKLRDLVRSYLERAGFTVLSTGSGAEAITMASAAAPDLIVLDLGLPDVPGETVASELRALAPTPIVMLTAKSAEEDRIRGLELGADDYVTKPFSPRELLARVRAALRRSTRSATSDVNSFDGISVDFTKMEVTRDGQAIGLTAQEFKTLKFMMRNAERVISRDELLNEVWGYQNYPSTRTVDNHILKLRQKLEKNPANPVHFRTVHGMGYKFVP